jgi:hypothetical protein
MKSTLYSRISVLSYVASMFLPVFGFDWAFLGIQALYVGWFGVVEGELFIVLPWLANLLYWANLIINRKQHHIRIALSVLTILCASYAVMLRGLHLGIGGNPEDVQMGPGFYIWMLSFVALLVDQIVRYRNSRSLK